MPPSIACSQLHSCSRFDTKRLLRRHHGEFPFRQRRLLLGRAHIGPQHAAALDQRIGRELDLLAEAAFDSGSDGTSMHCPVTSYFQP